MFSNLLDGWDKDRQSAEYEPVDEILGNRLSLSLSLSLLVQQKEWNVHSSVRYYCHCHICTEYYEDTAQRTITMYSTFGEARHGPASKKSTK